MQPERRTSRSSGSTEQLVGHQWDTVIDDSGYFPRHVDASARLLAKAAQRYIYISSISAKGEPPPKLADPTVLRAGPTAEQEQQLLAQFQAR